MELPVFNKHAISPPFFSLTKAITAGVKLQRTKLAREIVIAMMSPPQSHKKEKMNQNTKNKHLPTGAAAAASGATSASMSSCSSSTKNVSDAVAAAAAAQRVKKTTNHQYPVEPRIIQVIKNPKTVVDHSYRDFSNVPPPAVEETTGAAAGGGYSRLSIDDMSFAQKVYHMLSVDEYSDWMHWLPHGRAFKIAVPKRLEQSQILKKYFGHNRYSSFLRHVRYTIISQTTTEKIAMMRTHTHTSFFYDITPS
jgi:HSF-type DNA-binding